MKLLLIETDSLEACNRVEDHAELFPFAPDKMVEPPLVPFGESMNRELFDVGYFR